MEQAIAPELRIVEWQNEWIVKSAFSFEYQAPDEVLATLRDRYRLDEVIAPGQTEFEQMLLLREWVHTRFKHGWNRKTPAKNALEILAAAEQGSDFTCGYYALVLMQCLLSLGFVARRVAISKANTEWMAADEGNIGHSIMEVWSHQYHKWVMLDADLNVHYERDGVPFSALEIHQAWVTGAWDSVRQIQGPTGFRMTDQARSGYGVDRHVDDHYAMMWVFNRHQVGDYYHHVSIPMRNTFHSSDGPAQTVYWVDKQTPPNVMNRNQPGRGPWTSDVHDLYWTVDQVQINLQADEEAWAKGKAVLRITLEHSMPNLKGLQVRFDRGAWEAYKPERTWRLHPGHNEIMAEGVNTFGREGHISRISLRYHP